MDNETADAASLKKQSTPLRVSDSTEALIRSLLHWMSAHSPHSKISLTAAAQSKVSTSFMKLVSTPIGTERVIVGIKQWLIANPTVTRLTVVGSAQSSSSISRFRSTISFLSTTHLSNLTFFLRNLLDITLDFLTLKDVVTVGQLARYYRTFVQKYIAIRLNQLYGDWFEDVWDFRMTLKVAFAVIGGSTALSFIMGRDWGNQDLDVYAGFTVDARWLLERLQSIHGYEIIDRNPPYFDENTFLDQEPHIPHPPLLAFGTHATVRLQRTRSLETGETELRFINLIISSNRRPVTPIFLSHSTALMNFISPDTIYVGYPKLTFRWLNLIHPNQAFVHPSTSWFEKYRQRGFMMISDRADLLAPCGDTCGTIMRSLFDVAGMYIEFETRASPVRPKEGVEIYRSDTWALTFDGYLTGFCSNPFCGRYVGLPTRDGRPRASVPVIVHE